MEKKFLLVGVVAMLGVGSFVVSSCSDDDDGCKVCGQSFPITVEGETISCEDAKQMEAEFGCE